MGITTQVFIWTWNRTEVREVEDFGCTSWCWYAKRVVFAYDRDHRFCTLVALCSYSRCLRLILEPLVTNRTASCKPYEESAWKLSVYKGITLPKVDVAEPFVGSSNSACEILDRWD